MKNNNLIIVGLGSIGVNLANYLLSRNYKVSVWDKDLLKLKNFSKKNKIQFKKKFSKNIFKNSIDIKELYILNLNELNLPQVVLFDVD